MTKEVYGPGTLLGYRAMQKKLRQEHELKVPCNLVYAVVQDVDPQGLWVRGGLVVQNKRKKKVHHQRVGHLKLKVGH